MKKIMNFALMAALTVGLSFAVTSCKDDDSDNGGNGGGTEAVDDQTSLEEYQLRSVIANFVGMDAADVVLTKSYEPEIGVVDDESKPNVRSIAVGTVEKADETAVMLLSSLGIDASNPAGFSYSSDLVGTASYQRGGGDANTLATINLGLKQMPGLVQLRLTKTAGENANPLPRYKVGDIVKYKGHFWVCVYEAAAYKGNAYFVTFDHAGDLHATSTFKWTLSWRDTYWQHDTPMADANILGYWLTNCVLTDAGWNKVKGNYAYATNYKPYEWREENLEQMIPATVDKRKDFVTACFRSDVNNEQKFVTNMVSANQVNMEYANDDSDVWETYDNGKGKLKAPLELLCDATRYSENFFSNNQYWVPYLFLCSKSNAAAFNTYLNGIPMQNASRFKHSVINSSFRISSQNLGDNMNNIEVAIMTAARYWEHAYYDTDKWFLFDFTKDWRTKATSPYNNDDMWIGRCVTSKSLSIVDKGVTPDGYEDIYVGREDDVENTGSYENLDLETPFEGTPFYKFSDVYEDENGHRWFVINNAGYSELGGGDKSFYSELVSFDGLTPSEDKGCITNLPTRDQAIRAGIYLYSFFNQAAQKYKVARESLNAGDMMTMGYSIFNIRDNCNFDIRMLMQMVRSSKEEYYKRQPSNLMSIAYRDPKDTSGKQRLIRFVMNSANERNDSEFYVWDNYVSSPDDVTEIYPSYAYGPSNIYLQDIADQQMVSLYAKDCYAIQPLFSMDGWEMRDDYPARQARTEADPKANDVTNYLYDRDKWYNRTFPTDMWNSPVVMFRMTAVYDRGERDHATKTVDGHTLTLRSSRPWEENGMDLFEHLSGTIGIWYVTENSLYINGTKTETPTRKDVWRR